MKKLLILLAALTAASASAQETFFPMKQGAVLEYVYKDAKGKALRDQWRAERWLRMSVEQVWGDSLANVRIENQELERLGRSEVVVPMIADLQYGDVLSNAQGVTTDNMQWFFSPMPRMFHYMGGDQEVRKDDDVVSYLPHASATSHLPRELKIGDSLPDEKIKFLFEQKLNEKQQARFDEMRARADARMMEGEHRFKMPDRMDFTITGSISNRRVEGKERVKTPAGEFECWKITYNLVGPKEGIEGMPDLPIFMGRQNADGSISTYGMQSSSGTLVTPMVDYVSPTVGLVRRETLSDNGKKVVEVMELTKLAQ